MESEKIKGVIRLLGLIIMVVVFVTMIKHINKLGECVVEDPDTGEIILRDLWGDAQACQNLRKIIQPRYDDGIGGFYARGGSDRIEVLYEPLNESVIISGEVEGWN